MMPSRREIDDCRRVFRAIADPVRRGILDRLKEDGETAALDLGVPSESSQPALSKHLKVLRDAGLVRSRRAGRLQLYSLCPDPLRTVGEWVESYRCFWEERLDALGRHLDRNTTKRDEERR